MGFFGFYVSLFVCLGSFLSWFGVFLCVGEGVCFLLFFPTRWLPGYDDLLDISVAAVLHRLLNEFCSCQKPLTLHTVQTWNFYSHTHTVYGILLDT